MKHPPSPASAASEKRPNLCRKFPIFDCPGLPCVEVNPDLQVDAADSTEVVGQRAMRNLLARNPRINAVFAATDLMALGAMRALDEAGLKVPRDVAVVGFDDIPVASVTNPPLTTVAQDTKRAGELLVDTLLHLIKGEPASSVMLPARVVVRRSCGC